MRPLMDSADHHIIFLLPSPITKLKQKKKEIRFAEANYTENWSKEVQPR